MNYLRLSLTGLKYLPSLTPDTPLKQLDASNCSIEKIHESLLRPGINIDLRNNRISELPQEETLQFSWTEEAICPLPNASFLSLSFIG